MHKSNIAHGSFSLSRTVAAPVAKVFAAFADSEAKQQWFVNGSDGAPADHLMDFRVGGHEHSAGQFHDGMKHRFEAEYYDIVPEKRIIYVYEMYANEQRISVSLVTIAFQAVGQQTQLTICEDGVFLDGADTVESRQRGTEELFTALMASVEEV